MGDVRGLNQLNVTLGEMMARAGNVGPAMQEIGEKQVSSFLENFRLGGRPDSWKPSQRAIKHGGQTLMGSGRLMKSITPFQVDGPTLVFGSNLPYAAIHQYGFEGDETVRAHERRRFGRASEERVSKKTGSIYKTSVRVVAGTTQIRSFTRHMKMWARPFIVFQEQDVSDATKILAGFLSGRS